MSDPAKIAECTDALEHLARRGLGRLLDALSDPDCLTRRGKPKVIAIARKLKIGQPKVRAMLRQARTLLA